MFESHSANIFKQDCKLKQDKAKPRSLMVLVAMYNMEYWQFTESHITVFNITLAGVCVCYCLLLRKIGTVEKDIFALEIC